MNSPEETTVPSPAPTHWVRLGVPAWFRQLVWGDPVGRLVASSRNADSDLKATPTREQSFARQLAGEIRWAFTPPCMWLAGVGVNLALSFLWLLVVPLTGRPHRDWAILVGTYFAVFILADVTTTNVLGADALRVRLSLLRGVPLRRILFLKNVALFAIVGVPTLVLTAVITLNSEDDYRLAATLPRVMFPTLAWLGVGDVVSVLLPVAIVSLRQRWESRADRRSIARWLFHLALPYALLYAVDPVSRLPELITRGLGLYPAPIATRAVILCATGLGLWALGFVTAQFIAGRRGLRIR